MDLAKAKILLDKINALFHSMQSDAANIEPIEKDLMRNYLQHFYAELLVNPNGMTPPPTKPKEAIEVIKASPKPPAPPKVPEEEVSQPTPPVEQKPPRVIELSESLKEEIKESPPVKPIVPQNPPPVRAAGSDDELESLFETPKAKELSDKLSELPIPDLTKAMGLNEKIFTINELFGGDQELFKQTMQELNACPNFDAARQVLLNGVASTYQWGDKSNQRKAKSFIKLVRRRYQ